MRNDANFQKEDWELFFEFSMASAHVYPNKKKSIVLDMELEAFTTTDPIFLEMGRPLFEFNIGKNSARSPGTNKSGTSQMDQSFWENLIKVMGSGIGYMLHEQWSQHQPTATPSAHTRHREIYS